MIPRFTDEGSVAGKGQNATHSCLNQISTLISKSRCFTATFMSGFGHQINRVERQGSYRRPKPKDSHSTRQTTASDRKRNPSADDGFTVSPTLTHSQLPQIHSKEKENKLHTWCSYT